MESDLIFEAICRIFDYDDKTKQLNYTGKGTIYMNFLFNFCFLKEKGPIIFNSLEELWLLKEFNIQEQKKLNLDIIKQIISNIKGKDEFPQINIIDLVKKFVQLTEHKTLKIFKYLQSIYSCYSNNPSFIIYPLAYSIGFNKPQIQKCMKRDFKEIISLPLEQLQVDDNIEYNKINENFLKYFNGLLTLKEKKKECYDYLCNFNKNDTGINKLQFDESFSYFSLLEEIIREAEKKFIEENADKNGKNSISDTSDKTENNNSSDKNGSNNGEKNNEFLEEKATDIIIQKKANEVSEEDEQLKKSNQDKIIKQGINKEEIKMLNVGEKKKECKNEENKEDNKTELMSKLEKMIDEKINAQFFTSLAFNSKLILLNELLMKISFVIKTSKIKKESLEKYYYLKELNFDYKLLLDKLSSTIYILQNANIINLKRKLVECLQFEIFEKHSESLGFDSEYFPSKHHFDKLSEIIQDVLDKYEQKEKSKHCDKCDENGKCDTCVKCDISYETKKKEINADIERLSQFEHSNKLTNTDSNIEISTKNHKKYNKLKMVTEFLRFCKKNLNPLVHEGGEKINYYLLTNNLFAPDIKKADILLSLNDMIETKKIDNNNIKYQLDELNLSEDLNIYVSDKIITINEAIKILLNPQQFSINEKHYSKKLNEIKIELNQNLSNFNDYYDSFFKENIIEDLFDGNIDFYKIECEEKDLSKSLNCFKENLIMILNNKVQKDEALEIIKSIFLKIQEEAKKAKNFRINIENSNKDVELLKKEVVSILNRIYLILKFVEEQNIEFSNCLKQIYNKFENSSKEIIRKSECLKNLLESYTFIGKENLFDKWLKTNPKFDEKYLNKLWMENNIKDLISSVRLDLNYTFDEKFILWVIKNNFSQYLKNDF